MLSNPDPITADVLKALPPDCLVKTGKIAVRNVLGYELPGGVDVLFEGHGTKSCGRNEPGQVQADRWFVCDAMNPGLRLAQVAPSTAVNDQRMALTQERTCAS